MNLRMNKRKVRLDIHISSIHEKTKSFKCTVCGQRFSQRGKLNRDIRNRKHEGQKISENSVQSSR